MAGAPRPVQLNTTLVSRAERFSIRTDWIADLGRVCERCISDNLDLRPFLPEGWPGVFAEDLYAAESRQVGVPYHIYENWRFLAGVVGCPIKVAGNTLLAAYVHALMLGREKMLIHGS